MKHRLLLSLLLGGMALTASAQKEYTITGDVTSKITNAEFSADDPVTETIRTYDYDMPDNGAGSGESGAVSLFGMQPVTGWTANTPSDNTMVSESSANARTDGLNARAAGVFAYEDDSNEETGPGLGGVNFLAPYRDSSDLGTQALGIVAVWGGNPTYTQSVTLEAGAYMMVVKVHNVAGTGTLTANYLGAVLEDETSFYSTTTTFEVGSWTEEKIVFIVPSTQAVTLSLGVSFSGGSGTAPHLFIDNVKLYTINQQELVQEEIDKAKEELLDLIEIGKAYGVDTSDAQTVYDNPNATLAEVEDAIAKQQALNETGVTDLSEAFITNPHFTLDDPIEGGICTYGKDCTDNNISTSNFGMLPVNGWESLTYQKDGSASGIYSVGDDAFLGGTGYIPPKTLSDGVTTEGKVLGFVTCWTAAVQYTQEATLPPGKYTLTLSYYNSVGGTTAIEKNLIGFVEDNGTEHLGTKTTFPLNTWTSETIEFELEEQTTGYFSIGYKSPNTGSSNMPHFFTDGISLVYVGTGIDPTFLALQAAVVSGNKVVDEWFNGTLKGQLETALDNAQQLINEHSADADANRAAAQAIRDLLPDVHASIAAYQRLQSFYDNDLADALDKYEKEDKEFYENELGPFDDDVNAQLTDDATWSIDEVDAKIASLREMIKAHVQKVWDAAVASGEKLSEDLDISILFDNLGCTYSTTALQGTNVVDKQWDYGDATAFKTQYGTMEVWNMTPFEVKQTMTDLPAGTYTLKTRAFYRTAANDVNYSSYNPDAEYAFMFAGHQQTALTNVAAIASNDQEEFPGGAVAFDDGSTVWYVPNNQQTGHDVFENEAYDEQLLKSVSTVLTEPGDLTFGVRATEMESNCWVLWYTFELYYNALDLEVANEELKQLVEEATELATNSENIQKVTTPFNDLVDAITKGEAALDNPTATNQIPAINELNKAIASAKTTETLIERYNTEAGYFSELIDQFGYASDDAILPAMLNLDTKTFNTNEEVEEEIAKLIPAWANYVLAQNLSDASEDNAIDITGIILNADFEIGNANYWTLTEDIGQNQGYQGASYSGEATIDKFIEVWRQNAILNDGEVSQTLAAVLTEGYYTLEVDGHATNQSAIPEEGITGAYLMANVGGTLYLENMGITTTEANPQHFTLNFYSDGQSETKVGLLVQETNANWLAADNFKLSFIGTTAPTAIEELESISESIDFSNAKSIYNMAGQKLNKVQKGLNIVDGKKVMVK